MKAKKLIIVVAVFATLMIGFSSPSTVLADLSKIDLGILNQVAINETIGPGTQFVHIPSSASIQLASLDLSPVRMIDYGAFYWLELSATDFTRLQASNLPYVHVPEAGKIQVTRYMFDPLTDGEPLLPAEMRASYSGAGFRIIQFVGPIRDEWLAQLETTGLRVLQYYPHNSYLVWGTEAQTQAAGTLGYVRWTGVFHTAYKVNSDLDGRIGQINNVDILFYNDGNLQETLDAISRLGGTIIETYPAQPDQAFFDAIVQLDAGKVDDIARLNTVLWLGYSSPEPGLEDEMSSQIVAGNYVGGVPFTGYYPWLSSLGLSGAGVTWAIIDTGVDYQHPDLNTHIVGGHDYPGACTEPGHPGTDCPSGGHGTHVAGIVGGDATAGYTDPSGFLYGLGIAPEYGIFASNSLSASAWPPAGGWQEHSKWAVLGGAVGGNNSWTTGEGTNHGYQSSERTHDIMVLDGNWDTASVAEPFIEVFSAGNSGPGSYTLTSPKEAKNLTVVASSRNYRVGSIDTISTFSSRGPAADGRWVPTIAAPGEQIASTRNDTGGSCSTSIPGTNGMYAFCSGTSMAAPHISGSITLITEWWRNFNSGANPSSAMAKALMVNGAVDMGTSDIPNINEGWGRVNLTNIFDNGAYMAYYDQPVIFSNTGEDWEITVGVLNPALPLKVTLAWADAPGAIGANPALVNNLNLTVVNGSNTYYGNVFSAGWSQTGGTPDAINNLENVYVQNPSGSATITVQAVNIAGDAVLYNGDPTDQSFALVCYNCALGPDFTMGVDPSSLAICAPEDANYAVSIGSMMGFSNPVTLSAIGNPAGTSASFDVNPVIPPGNSTLTIGDTGLAAAGSYNIDIVGVAPTKTHTATVGLDLFTDVPSVPVLLTPEDGATNVPLEPAFDWADLAFTLSYNFELATSPLFETPVVVATGLTASEFTVSEPLDGGTCYWWHTQADNSCGSGEWADPFHFRTATSQTNPPPGIIYIEPNSGWNGEPTPVVITGEGFFGSPALRLGDTWLESVEVVSPTSINAVVPAGMPEGVYDLELFNGDCQSEILVDAFTVSAVQIPVSGLTAGNDSPTNLGDATNFTAAAAGTGVYFTWDFGDGTQGNGSMPSHVYASIGQFTATVTATNSLNSETETTLVIIEEAIEGLEASNDSPTMLGNATTFTASVSGGSNIIYTWDFGDGTTMTGQVVQHVYGAVDSYTATVTATNALGFVDAETIAVVEPAKFYSFLTIVSR